MAIHQHTYDNGLVLLAEPINSAQSLSMSLICPAGASAEPGEKQGVGAVLTEMMPRGAGNLDARAHSAALDRLGVRRGPNVETVHLRLSATMLADKLQAALPLLADMVLRPHLPESAFAPSVDLAIQSLDALEDEPQRRVFHELRHRHYAEPFNRSPLGRREQLEQLTLEDVRAYLQTQLKPSSAILGFAGRFDWNQLRDQVGEVFGGWQGQAEKPVEASAPPRGYTSIDAQSAQVHIGLAYDAVAESHPDAMLQRAAIAVLSGGMSGRLFTEVRERRGLCYAVGAQYIADAQRGAVGAYAGTSTARAQETLDQLVIELRRLGEGVQQDEFDRAMVGMKSGLVMQGESTGARAAAIASDQDIYGAPRTLDQIIAQVEAVTLERLNEYVAAHRPGEMTIVTIGPNALNPPA